MEEIKTKRINGYLDLDSYFFKSLGRKYKSLEDLYVNGLIDYEVNGKEEKFWVLSPKNNQNLALFKELSHPGEAYAELLAEEIANILEIPVAHYDLATFNGQKGVISYNFNKENKDYYSGFDIIADFYEQELLDDKEKSRLYGINYYSNSVDDASDHLNNLEDIWLILEKRLKENPNKQFIVSKIVNGLVDKLIFDVLTVNVDSHCENWGIVENELSPLFDNSRILNMHQFLYTHDDEAMNSRILENKTLLFGVDNSYIREPLEILEQFLKISSSEYKDMVVDKVEKLENNIDFIPTIIEKRTEHVMPRDIKNYFLTSMHQHLVKVNEVINANGKVTKK